VVLLGLFALGMSIEFALLFGLWESVSWFMESIEIDIKMTEIE